MKERKRIREKTPGGNSQDQGPFSKQRKEQWKCQREEKQEWKNNENLTGIKKNGMIIFNPKMMIIMEKWKEHDFQSLAGWDEHKERE